MIPLSKRILFLIAGLLLLLFCVNLWFQRDTSLANSDTSFGVGVDGYKGAYDLLHELGFPVTRSYVRPNHVAQHRMLWMIMPDFLSTQAMLTDTDVNDLKKWIRAGGIAVVMGDVTSHWERLDIKQSVAAVEESTSKVSGDFSHAARTIPIPALAHFNGADANDKVRLSISGKPFAIDQKVGSGRLIAIADGRFVLNSNLDQGDASVLLVDLVRQLGAPDLDEHSHGLVASESAFALFSNPRLLILLAIGAITALLWIAQQHSFPPRTLCDEEGPAPSLDSFVESLSALYSRSNDPPAVFAAYRASFLRRVRRQLSPKIEISERSAIERLCRDRSLTEKSRRWLEGDQSPYTDAELVQAVRALESCPGLLNEPRRE
jgi:hypothetical protein